MLLVPLCLATSISNPKFQLGMSDNEDTIFPPLPMGAVNLCWADLGFPGGPVVKSLPANAADLGLIPGPGGFHKPWSNQAAEPQPLSSQPRPVLRSTRSHCDEKPRTRPAARETPAQQGGPARPNVKLHKERSPSWRERSKAINHHSPGNAHKC